jgi:AbrB family looped-hinge helix DNA binding protein
MTSKGQVTIPRQIRQKLKLKQGSLLNFVLREDRAEMAAVEDDVLALKGSVRAKGPQDFRRVRAEVEGKVAEDAVGEA